MLYDKKLRVLMIGTLFLRENRRFLIDDSVNTLFKNRNDNMYYKIANNINRITGFQKNTAVFFTSYNFMDNVLAYIETNKNRQIKE